MNIPFSLTCVIADVLQSMHVNLSVAVQAIFRNSSMTDLLMPDNQHLGSLRMMESHILDAGSLTSCDRTWSGFRILTVHAIDSVHNFNSIYTSDFASAAAAADDLFARHYIKWHSCECPGGLVTSVLFRTVPFLLSDREGWLERFLNFAHLVVQRCGTYGGFPVLRFLYFIKILGLHVHPRYIVETYLSSRHEYIYATVTNSSEQVERFIDRWAGIESQLYVLSRECPPVTNEVVTCTESHFRSHVIAKYTLLSKLLEDAVTKSVVFVDAEAVMLEDPTYRLFTDVLENCKDVATVAIPTAFAYETLTPWLIALCASDANRSFIASMLNWLHANPAPVEAQGLEHLLGYSSSTVYISKYSDGISTSFLTSSKSDSKLRILDSRSEFVSAEGWVSSPRGPFVFHPVGLGSDHFLYKVRPQAISVLPRRFRMVVISYADKCCVQAQKLNTATAFRYGADEVVALNRTHLAEEFMSKNQFILDQAKGGGYWLWKPWIILAALRNTHADIVVYSDAGNHFKNDLREFAIKSLSLTDVAAPILTCCLESDWTRRGVLQFLAADHPLVTDRPQIGAYLIVLRRTEVAISFIEKWLQLCEYPALLMDGDNSTVANYPTFNKHVHDQSLFSVMFKKRGFRGIDATTVNNVLNLARWRDYPLIR